MTRPFPDVRRQTMPAADPLLRWVAGVLFAALPGTVPAAEATTPSLARAEAAADELGRSLREALTARLLADGAPEAVEFCHAQAPVIAGEVAIRHGVQLGRIGVRLRNPANAATGWQAEVLQAFAKRAAAGEAPEQLRHVETAADGSLRYARGIRTEAPCLVCHGPALPAAVAAAVAARYPDDHAHGFGEGELRGALWVEVPAGTALRNDGAAARD